jgi:hypothetical protein
VKIVHASPEQWERVARALRDARGPATQDDCVTRAESGITKAVWSKLENARAESYKERTIRAACRGVGWTPDSIQRIIEGGDPVPVTTEVRESTGTLSSADVLQQEMESLRQEMRELRRALSELRDAQSAAGGGSRPSELPARP